MSTPRVRKMVLFKHGVAYLERAGEADGPFELSFKKDEMNDVLKSLSVWVARGEAKVGAVGFEKPEDPEEALAERRLHFGQGAALSGILHAVRGRRVALFVGDERIEGEVLGVEHSPAREGEERRTLVLRATDDRLQTVNVASVSEIALLEAPSRADMAFLADRSRAATAGDSRTVRVDVRGRADDLRVSYVVPAPTWRVSYRVAREKDATLLMGWAIVHNPADEDLEDLELVLTTGQPVSFVIDLYNPKEIRRAVVEEEERVVAAPSRFERAPMLARSAPMPPPAAAPAGIARRMMAEPAYDLVSAEEEEAPTTGRMGEGLAAAGDGAADYADRGELFEYRIGERISLKRGGSAMVPLFFAKVEAEKERIWRVGAPPAPDLVLTFENTSGAVLEEGPAVVYDEGVYAGESMVPYSARGADVKLGFAKDLGVRCKHASTTKQILSAVHVKRAGLLQETRTEIHHEITCESDHAEKVRVVAELPKVHGRTFDDAGAKPFEDTMSFHRFAVEVEPRSRGTIRIVERWVESTTIRFEHLTPEWIAGCLKAKLLEADVARILGAVLESWKKAADLEAKKQRVSRQRDDAYTKQKRISEQLGVLKDGGAEGTLRLRYVKELEAEQDKVNKAEKEMQELDLAIDAARKEAGERLAGLR
jgi:hypothetical protein